MCNLISSVKTRSWTGQDKLQAFVIFPVLNTKIGAKQNSPSLQQLQQYFLEERAENQNCAWGKKWTERKQTLPHYPTIKLLLKGSIAQASCEANSHVHNTSVKGCRIHFIFLHLLLLCIMLVLGSHSPSAPSPLWTRSQCTDLVSCKTKNIP